MFYYSDLLQLAGLSSRVGLKVTATATLGKREPNNLDKAAAGKTELHKPPIWHHHHLYTHTNVTIVCTIQSQEPLAAMKRPELDELLDFTSIRVT